MAETIAQTHLTVLGGGPAGYGAAFRAADLGLETTLIDLDPNPGGTCLYRGCIPSKALLHVARIISEAREAEHFGVHFGAPRIDVDRLREATRGVVKQMTGGLGQLGKARKIKYLQGRGSFLDSNTLRVHLADGNTIELHYKTCILATGSRPAIIPDLDRKSTRLNSSHIQKSRMPSSA